MNNPPPGYKEFSRTSSGGIIYTNPDAPPDQRWLIIHRGFGDKYFTNHDDILDWTVTQIVELTRKALSRG